MEADMALRQVKRLIRARPTLEGAGVRLRRAFGFGNTADFDPFLRFILVSGRPLREPVAWYGPIVMNTQEELRRAFRELREGTFLQHEPVGKGARAAAGKRRRK
jgi:redox-sensitive bicupin YhaK (pirin superfamily)